MKHWLVTATMLAWMATSAGMEDAVVLHYRSLVPNGNLDLYADADAIDAFHKQKATASR